MLKNRVFYVLLLLLAVMMYIFTNTYYTLLLLAVCIVLPVISLTLMMIAGNGLKITADIPASVEKSAAGVKYIMNNKSIMPVAQVMFTVGMENQLTGSKIRRKVNATVGGRKTVTADLELQNAKSGAVMISTEKIRVYDVLGLFTLKKTDLHKQTMVVYPDMDDIAIHMEKPVETRGDGSRFSPDRPGPDVSEIFALREYASGDEIRKIHWKLSSKIDRMMVREFSLPLNYSVFLLMELTEDSEDAVDSVVETYLSLSRGLLENGINHNLAWFDAGAMAFNVRAMDDFEDLDMAVAEVLSSYPSAVTGAALDYYTASGYRNDQTILIYIVSKPDLDKIAEVEVAQRMRTVLVYEDESARTEAEQTIDVMPVPVNGSLPEIIV